MAHEGSPLYKEAAIITTRLAESRVTMEFDKRMGGGAWFMLFLKALVLGDWVWGACGGFSCSHFPVIEG